MNSLTDAATVVAEEQTESVVAGIGDPGLGSDVFLPAGITDPGYSPEAKRPGERPLPWPLFA